MLLCNQPENLVKLHEANIRGKILDGCCIECQEEGNEVVCIVCLCEKKEREEMS